VAASSSRIVATIADEIETAECQRAVLKEPSSLDAWEAYHRGLWHMYKFNEQDNHQAERFFRTSLDLAPDGRNKDRRRINDPGCGMHTR
jgi:hypothetical protein